MAELSTNAPTTYHPEFNPTTEKYEDVCPIPPRQVGKHRYICHCMFKEITTRTEFNSHIKTKTHQRFIDRYHEKIRDLNTAQDYIKKLMAENMLLKREIERLRPKVNHYNVTLMLE